MPRTNPKHQKRRVVASRQQQLSTGGFPTRYLVMTLILVGAVVAIIVLVVTLNKDNDNKTQNLSVQDNDIVILKYKLWTNPNLDPIASVKNTPVYQESTNFQRNVSKDNIQPTGFYYNILGMKISESKYFALPANVDDNGDKVDDITSQEVLSYGKPTDALYNTPLVYWVEIVNITKSDANKPSSSGLNITENQLNSYLNVFSISNLFLLSDLF
jgi:hypothetical protein